jgi:hypothetical protein
MVPILREKSYSNPCSSRTNPEGYKRLGLSYLKTIGGYVCQPYAPAASTPQEIFLVLIYVKRLN